MGLLESLIVGMEQLSGVLGLHDLVIAVYFGLGAMLIQLFHTIHSEKTYGQKQVRALDWLPWFSREDPKHPNLVKLSWWPIGNHDEEQRRATAFLNDDWNGQAQRPSELPEIQTQREDIPERWRDFFVFFGLQATNLYYCYFMSVVYGILGIVVVYYLVPSLSPITILRLTLFGVFFAILHGFSFLFVGSSVALTLLEGNLSFNTLVLVALVSELLSYGDAVSVLQFGAALTVGPLVFWLHFQYDKGHIEYGNFLAIYYIIVPILYSEFFVLLLGLQTVN